MALSLFTIISLWSLKLLVILTLAWSSAISKPRLKFDPKRFQILVLGDIGRSPRMQYHALSIVKHGGSVDLIGYCDSDLHPDIVSSPNIKVHALSSLPGIFETKGRRNFIFIAPLKVIFQLWSLSSILLLRMAPCISCLVQNPPSIPTLAIALICCRLRGVRLVVDWHNFGYSILALKLGKSHPLVYIARLYERVVGSWADAHFCVTSVMARSLAHDFSVTSFVQVLHDRPAPIFQPFNTEQRRNFLVVLNNALSQNPSSPPEIEMDYTEVSSKNTFNLLPVAEKQTKMIVSATSWTADEDFSILLDSLIGYSQLRSMDRHLQLPQLVVIITGKGPMKKEFEKRARDLIVKGSLQGISIVTAFFNHIEDYASMLACADLGISLHTSSSGVDLPMKVVDMLGAGLPVAGYNDFPAWPELVTEGQNGMGFKSAAELKNILAKVFDKNATFLLTLREGALQDGKKRWSDEWDSVAPKPLGLRAVEQKASSRLKTR